jgi:hypothetical protein
MLLACGAPVLSGIAHADPAPIAVVIPSPEPKWVDVPSATVSDLAECRVDARQWQAVRALIVNGAGKGSAKARGWTLVNPAVHDLVRYRLPKAVSVHGMMVEDVAVAANGIFGIVTLADPAAFAKTIGIDSENWAGYSIALSATEGETVSYDDASGTFLGERDHPMRRAIVPETGMPGFYRSVTTMFDRGSVPGKVFLGCVYHAGFDASGVEADDAVDASVVEAGAEGATDAAAVPRGR